MKHTYGDEALVLALLACLAACSDPITSSTGPEIAPDVRTKPASESPRLQPNTKPAFTAVASQLSVYDEDGTLYTLSVPDREIRMSDGRVLVLEDDQMNLAIEAFYGTIATDPVATDISTLAYEGCSTPDSKVGCEAQSRLLTPPDAPGAEPRGGLPAGSSHRPPLSGQSQSPSRKLLWWRPDDSRRSDSPRRIMPYSRTRPTRPTAMGSLGSVAFANFSYATSTDPCHDIATDAVSRASAYFNKRTSFVRDIWPLAIVEGANWARRRVPRGYAVFAKFAEQIANHEASRIEVNILAFYWNSYGCSSRQVTVGPIFMGGGSGAGSVTCEWQTWRISFDNWAHSSWISVRVCYAME
jgi:hypothetical protein